MENSNILISNFISIPGKKKKKMKYKDENIKSFKNVLDNNVRSNYVMRKNAMIKITLIHLNKDLKKPLEN